MQKKKIKEKNCESVTEQYKERPRKMERNTMFIEIRIPNNIKCQFSPYWSIDLMQFSFSKSPKMCVCFLIG